MKKLKKLLAVLLVVCIFTGCFISNVSAEDENIITAGNYDELKNALESGSDTAYTVMLTDDITFLNGITIQGTAGVTLDLNGHTLTFAPENSSNTTYAFTVSASNCYLKNEMSEGGIVNLSKGDYFFKGAGKKLHLSGTINGNISTDSNIYFDDCNVNGNVRASNIYINSAKNVNISGDVYSRDMFQMTDGNGSLKIDGILTAVRRATIYSGTFNSDVFIAKDFVYNSGDGSNTVIYGGTFNGKLAVADNITLKYTSSNYNVNIYGGKFYDKVSIANPNEANIGNVRATIAKGYFYKDAEIVSEKATVSGGNFTYTFTDENGNELKSVLAKYKSTVYAPTVPKKDGYSFVGWNGFTENMKVDKVYKFKAEYEIGEDSDTSKYEEVNIPAGVTADGVSIEGVTKLYTDIATPDTTFDKSSCAEVSSTAVYGLSDYIPANNGDIFRVSAVKTNVYEGELFAVAYDSDKKVLGAFVHNEHNSYAGLNMSFVGRRAKRYSIGLLNDKSYYFDVEFRVPSKDEGSLMNNIAYLRFKALKSTDTRTALINKEDFYVGYMGNTDEAVNTSLNHIEDVQNDFNNTPKSTTVGDLNGDGQTGLADILYLKKHLAKYDGYTVGLCNADLDFDGKINIKDVIYYIRHAAGWDGYKLEKPKFIALSFDDAPGSMSSVLDYIETLKSDKVRVTYMLNGSRVRPGNVDLLKRADKMGVQLGNHSTFHEYGVSGSIAEIVNDVNFTQDIIYDSVNKTNKYFRAPFFAVTGNMKTALADMVFIEGTQSSDTSNSVTAEKSAETQLSQAKDGNIVLLHDNSKLVDTLKIMIPELLSQGYKLVTIDELFKYCNVTPQAGKIYTNVFTPKAS